MVTAKLIKIKPIFVKMLAGILPLVKESLAKLSVKEIAYP